jgi:hypothetical protein
VAVIVSVEKGVAVARVVAVGEAILVGRRVAVNVGYTGRGVMVAVSVGLSAVGVAVLVVARAMVGKAASFVMSGVGLASSVGLLVGVGVWVSGANVKGVAGLAETVRNRPAATKLAIPMQ